MAWRLGGAIGRVATTVGLLLLAFAAFQLWGTGQFEARAQAQLSAQLSEQLAGATTTAAASASTEPAPEPVPADAALVGDGVVGDTVVGGAVVGGAGASVPVPLVAEPAPETAVAPLLEAPEEGEPFAAIRIPAIGLDKAVVGGTTREALRSGPGHYPGTALPGRPGNVAIAGHRTTYGAPFKDLDALVPGDEIVLETADGLFTYRVEDQSEDGEAPLGHRIVSPDDVWVIADRGDDRVTLTACHPLYSARERIVVTAVLDGPALTPPDPTPPATTEVALAAPAGPGAEAPPEALADVGPTTAQAVTVPTALGDDLGWQPEEAGATARWAGLTALIAGAAWGLGRLWRRWPAYAVAAPSFTLALVTCFGHLDRLIPAT